MKNKKKELLMGVVSCVGLITALVAVELRGQETAHDKTIQRLVDNGFTIFDPNGNKCESVEINWTLFKK